MSRFLTRSGRAFLLILGSVAAHAGAAGAQRVERTYRLVDIGTLGGESSEAAGLNNLGDVVGASATTDGRAHAFLYRNGQIGDLGTLPGGTSSYATAINDRGVVVGYGGINAYGPQFHEFVQGFAWREGAMRAVGALFCPCSFNARYGTSKAFAVSDEGWVVGDSQTNRQTFRGAFVWEDNALRALGLDLGLATDSHAYGINDIHEVVGDLNNRATLTRDGATRDLGVLPGYATSTARAVNNKGQVVGIAARPDGAARGFLWDLGTLRELAALPGDLASEAYAINVAGEIVGRSGDAGFSQSRAVLWRRGMPIDLNTVAGAGDWTLSSAAAINEFGQIAGAGVHNGQGRAFLLIPE